MTEQTTTIRAHVEQAITRATEIRQDLHTHPEIRFEEQRTSSVVLAELESLSIERKGGLARGTGVLGFLPAKGAGVSQQSAKTVGLRADMDALPILEETGLAYASKNEGVMHACGHDGHTATLLGAARVLAGLDERPNNVMLVFQPAEEGGAGAEAMCEDGALDGSALGEKIDVMHGLHGWPEMEAGVVAVRNGPLLAATDEFVFTIHGKGGHAAWPHLCIDPIVIGAKIVDALQTVSSRTVGPTESVIVTIGQINAGNAKNVIPDSLTMGGTMRSLTDEIRTLAGDRVREIVTGIASAMGGRAEISWRVGYPVTHNDPGATDRVRKVVREAFGERALVEYPTPVMGGEDFSYYSRLVPASFSFVGLRPTDQASYPNLHTPRFDFNDGVLPRTIELMSTLAVAGV